MNSSEYKKNQFKYLCSQLGCKTDELENLINNIDNFYFEYFEKKKIKGTNKFKTFKNGEIKRRIIRPSLKLLKLIQYKIKSKILNSIPLPPHINGGVRGKSNISNAKHHQGKKYQFTTDLKDFYPGIKHSQVYEMFIDQGFSHHISGWLTKLTTWKGIYLQEPQPALILQIWFF